MLNNLNVNVAEKIQLSSETFEMSAGLISLGDAVELTLGSKGCTTEGNNSHRECSE